jgi:plastocyanin
MTVDPSPDVTPVKPYWVSVVPCVSDPQYTVPGGGEAGSTHTRSRGFTVPETGRIVAVGGHLHGGSHELRLTQPGCDRRTIALNDPVYAPAGDPLYAVRPLLHEPDPKNITWTQWSDGWGVTAGQRLRLSAVYDNERPHMRVMGIAHVYLAPDESVPPGCSEPPTGGETLGPAFEGRREPPASKLTLASWDGNGRARAITRPPGAIRRVSSSSAAVRVENFAFNPAVLSVPRDATVRWSFRDRTVHDATLVVGPRGFATATTRGRTARHRFRVPGEYRLNCSIHPVLMQQVIRVRPGR